MLFKMKFKIVENRDGGVVITHYLSGSKRDVKRDIEKFKKESKKYEMFGKEGMIVWT